MHKHKLAAAAPKVTFWLLVALLVGFVLYIIAMPAFDRIRGAKAQRELANLRAIHAAVLAYASDHDTLPSHAAVLIDSDIDYLDPDEDRHVFQSPFDSSAPADPLTPTPTPPGDWYTCGSYRFYPTAGLSDRAVAHPHDFILAHGPAHSSPPKITAIFLDGHIEVLTQDELDAFIDAQPTLIIALEPEPADPSTPDAAPDR